jgi:hypothetical protein
MTDSSGTAATAGAGWAVPQEFAPATSHELRDQLGDLISRDLLGPWDGEEERFRPRAQGPRERYLVGMLGPKHTPGAAATDADETSDMDLGAAGGAEPELPDVLTPQNVGRIWASSMGLSFAVDRDAMRLAVTVEWGQYGQVDAETENGLYRKVWAREPVSREIEVEVGAPGSDREWLVGAEGDAYGVWLVVETRDHAGRRVVRLTLVNGQSEAVTPKDTAWLFQTGIAVTAADGPSSVFESIDDPLDPSDAMSADAEERHLRLLYRDRLRHAIGHNVAVHADVRDGERDAWRLATTWLPTYDVPATTAATGRLADLETSMDALAALADGDATALAASLAPLAREYGAWLAEQEQRIPTLPQPLRGPAEAAVFRAREVARRLAAGIDVLSADPTARQAFAFANRAMALQRRTTAAAALRAADQTLDHRPAFDRIAARGAAAASWRPFQLAFVLLNLPALTTPGHPERAGLVDLLFFPTGGGKTEAYLGLAAYTFAIRRLQRVVGAGADARDGGDGVAVLMRYTLRLLTAQQFQRAAALVCAAEVLRQGDPATWGAERFRIGLWVGNAVSPNWYPDAKAQVEEAREAGRGERASVLQTLACPWCGSQLAAHRDIRPDDTVRRIILYCSNAEGPDACPFSQPKADREGLPILTVDEEIYRHPPSLLIATVDKLAQLPWYGYAGMLFGRVSRRCPRHGYRHPDLDQRTGCTDRHNAAGGLPRCETVPVTRLRPPDLVVQDELHLISGALGTVVGLFEGAVDDLCGWTAPGGGRTGPKIVASTATTKHATTQVRRLFARDLAVFPPPVLDVTDTFFSAQMSLTATTPGRRYLGVCAHGVRLKSAEIRLAEILLLAGQTMLDRHGKAADPYLTLVGYFNAVRELAGMRRLLDDDVATRVRWHGRSKGLSDRLLGTGMLRVAELTSRINSGDIADVLAQLEVEFDPEVDTAARRRAIMAEYMAARKERREPVAPRRERLPVDVVLATSMLQVGVDVPRFGLMLVVGQPKNTAEYIQASSRVGREAGRPGLVVTLYNWTRPRDLAHFEDFEHYHATFYRQVEALSVTPYARRALDRGTAATYVAAVRNATEPFSPNTAAYDVDLNGEVVSDVSARLLDRAERAGGPRARGYLGERINALKDRWAQAKGGSARLGYQQARERGQQIVGLLEAAGEGAWTELTVGRSMRETENEINLLVPASGLFDAVHGAPDWTFAPAAGPDDDAADADGGGDEMGVSPFDGERGGR